MQQNSESLKFQGCHYKRGSLYRLQISRARGDIHKVYLLNHDLVMTLLCSATVIIKYSEYRNITMSLFVFFAGKKAVYRRNEVQKVATSNATLVREHMKRDTVASRFSIEFKRVSFA